MFQITAALAALALVVVAVLVSRRPGDRPFDPRVPAALCVLFLAWSVLAVVSGGPVGFWALHTENAWGNQVWFDLLLSVGTAWVLLRPRLHAAGVSPWPWLVLTLATGSIGLLATVARLLHAEQLTTSGATASVG